MAGPSIAVKILGDLAGLSKSVDDAGTKGKGAADKMHSAFSGVLGALNQSGVLGPFGAALSTADAAISSVLGHGKELGPVMMGVGGAMLGVGMALQQIGSKDQAAHQQLQASVEATGHSYSEYADRVDAAIKHQEHFGTTADVTQDALRKLTQATNDPGKALDMLGVAADLAAAKHEDLSTASSQLAKASMGSAKILKEFGLTAKDAAGHTKTQSEITSELAAKLQGQASAAANTFSGRINALKASVTDSVSAFAQKFGPAITAAGAAMTGLGAAFELITALKDADIAATIAHTAVTVAHTAATGAATAATWLFNLAMDANPIMIVVLALAALVGAVILAYTHITVFRQIVDEAGRIAVAVFEAIKNAALAVVSWLAANWPLVLAILTGPFGMAVFLISKYWDQIVGFAASIPGRILGALGDLGGLLYGAGAAAINGMLNGANAAWGAVSGWVGGIPGRITGAIGDVGNLLYNAGKSIIDGLGRGITDALKAVENTVGGIAGKIASLKGPLDYDRTLLVPHGKAIMAGLSEGISLGLGDVNALVSSVAPSINASVTNTSAGAATSSGPAVVVQSATFSSDVDVDSFMQRAAWVARTRGL